MGEQNRFILSFCFVSAFFAMFLFFHPIAILKGSDNTKDS
jgi:hypothetical protein